MRLYKHLIWVKQIIANKYYHLSIIIGSVIMCAILSYMLYLINRIPRSHHIVCVSHKMHNRYSDNIVNASITIFSSSRSGKTKHMDDGILESDYFEIRQSQRQNDTMPIHPAFSSYSELELGERYYAQLFKYLNKKNENFHIANDGNIIEYIHLFDTDFNSNILNQHFGCTTNVTTGDRVWDRHMAVKDLDYTGGLLDELFLQDVLEYMNKEKELFSQDGFDIDINKTYMTTVVFGLKSNDRKEFGNKDRKEDDVYLYSFFSPFDITKELISVGYLAEAIDTFTIKIKFDEPVLFKATRVPASAISANDIVFKTTANSRKLSGFPDRFFSRVDINEKKVNTYFAQSYRGLENNTISILVEKASSQRIQWIRLSILTFLLGYFIALTIYHLTNYTKIRRQK